MAWNSNLKKGTDLPTWDWLSFFPGSSSYPGSCLSYDGIRYSYASMQIGSTGASSTTALWRYDTWSDGWQQLSSVTSSFAGADCVYDPVRNVHWATQGGAVSTWTGYNLSPTYPATSNNVVATASAGSKTLTISGGVDTGNIIVGAYAAGTLGAVTVAGAVTAISGNVITISNAHGGTGTGTGLVSIGNSYATVSTVSGSGTVLTVSGTWSSAILTGSIVVNNTTGANIPTGAVVLGGQGTANLLISQSVTAFSAQTVAFFQPNTLSNGATAVSGLALSPYSNLTMSPTLPLAASTSGASMALVEDVTNGDTMTIGTVATVGSFTGSGATLVTSFGEAISTADINVGHVGCSVRFTGTSAPTGRGIIQAVSTSRGNAINSAVVGTSGANTITLQSGNTATTLGLSVGMTVTGVGIGYGAVITVLSGTTVTLSVPNTAGINPSISSTANFVADLLTVSISGGSLSGAPTIGNTYFVEYPQGTATSGSTTTLVDTTQNWNTNTYRDSDVVIVSGTGAGQRRRIASNTSNTLTLNTNFTGLTATLSLSTNVVTVTSTAGLVEGMVLAATGTPTGAFGAGAVITAITSATTFTTSVNHATAGALTFSATYSVNNTFTGLTTVINDFVVASLGATLALSTNVVTLTSGTTTNLTAGMTLAVTSGSGAFGASVVITSITSSSAFTVSVNHATAGAVVFSATNPVTNTNVVTLTTGTTSGLTPGMALAITAGTGGTFGAGAVITAITSTTTFSTSVNHATAGAGTITLSATSPTITFGRTGSWTTAPDNTSKYKIVPSSDFLYYIPGGSNAIYRIDLNTNNTPSVWSGALTNNGLAIGNFAAGATLMYGKNNAPFSLFATRAAVLYRYDIGAQAWSTVNSTLGYSGQTTLGSADSLHNGGANAAMLPDHNRVAFLVAGTTRLYTMRLSDGFIEPLGTLPYAAPASYDGRRMFYAKSIDGVPWLYFQRAGGGEFYRYALEVY